MKSSLCTLLALLPLWATAEDITSPDGKYKVSIHDLTYSVTYNNKVIVESSPLGVEIDNRLFESALGVPRDTRDPSAQDGSGAALNWCRDLVLTGSERMTSDTTWTPLYGENATVRDHYNQLTMHYEKGSDGQGALSEGYDKRKYYAMDVIVRAYDEGIAVRYHFPETSNSLFLHITGERTQFAMPRGTTAWYEEWAQGPYEPRLLQRDTWFESERPLLMQLPDGTYVALLEAALRDFPRGKFTLHADNVLQVALYGTADIMPPYDTPWRVVMAAERAVDLINHKDLVLNLNEPADSSSVTLEGSSEQARARHSSQSEAAKPSASFVKPGKAFRSGRLEKAAIFRSIDFCAEFGIPYVELDAGWYGPEGRVASDARQVAATRDFTLPEVCDYARSRGIGVWVYVNQRALARQLDELLPLYEQWGISGIKFGFVHIGSQQWTTWLHEAVAKCARHHIMVDVHDEYRPTGVARTLPNLLTQEGIRGNEEMPDATHNVTLPYTRFLCGPADYTLCYFNRRVRNTRGHQLAMAAVYYSPLQFLFWYDNPYPSGWDSEELQFWRHCPTTFDASIALDGTPGQYIVQARRSGRDWFVGAMTNTEARTVAIPTDFLPEGRYEVTIYNDAPTAEDPKHVAATKQIVNRKSKRPIVLQLQPSGGAALHFTPINR